MVIREPKTGTSPTKILRHDCMADDFLLIRTKTFLFRLLLDALRSICNEAVGKQKIDFNES